MEPGTGTTVASSSASSSGGGTASTSAVMRPPLTALFREIHKNSWLRRLNSDSRRPSVLNKKPDRYWVVFCVHDDCEAFLEGFSDPRQAPSHAPEWSLSLQTVQHISHALVSVEQEFEFVITLGSEVARFNANTWECMQEWVDCLRSKLREMKLLSPKENLYSRLPEVRPPLAPTRDPTSPLPATPPVPAAIVPGIERVQTSAQLPLQQSLVEFNHSQSHQAAVAGPSGSNSFPTVALCTSTTTGQSASLPASAIQTPGCSSSAGLPSTNTGTTSSTSSSSSFSSASSSSSSSSGSYSSTLTSISSCPNGGLNPPAMSNTSTQNLMNLLSNPLQAVSSINAQSKSMQNPPHPSADASSVVSAEHHEFPDELLKRMGGCGGGNTPASSSNLPKPQKIITRENGPNGTANHNGGANGVQQQHHQCASSAAASSSSLATTFVNNVLADPSGAVASLKRTDKLLLDVRAGGSDETNACDDDEHVAEGDGVLARDNDHDNHDVVVSAGNDGSSEGGEEQQSLHQRHLQHAFGDTSQKGANDCRSVCISNGSEPLHSSSNNDVVVSSESQTMASNCGGMQPGSIVSPAAVSGSRIDPKRSCRKISPLAVQSSPPAALHVEQVTNVTIIQVSNSSTSATTPSPTITTSSPKPMPRFNFLKAKPSPIATVATTVTDDDGRGDNNYKSNVQIIPSNVEYEQPNSLNEVDHLMQPSIIASINEQQITTVTVPNVRPSPATPATLGQAPPPTVQIAVATSSTPIKGPENNFGTVTQISVNSTVPPHGGSVAAKRHPPSAPQHYEQVFLTSSTVQVTTGGARAGNPSSSVDIPSVVPVAPGGNTKLAAAGKSSKVLLLSKQQRSSSHSEIVLTPVGGRATKHSGGLLGGASSDKENHAHHVPSGPSSSKQGVLPSASSPAVPVHLAGGSPSKRPAVDRNIYTPHPQRAPLLQRGLTELVLSTRSSPTVVVGSASAETPVVNGRSRAVRAAPIENKIRQDHLPPEQRRRSSSTSDARQDALARVVGSGPAGGVSRLQSPPQPFRPHHPLINTTEGVNAVAGSAGGNRKLTLREQQVFQLRREMMHPGGVRLQLRRKDCINSIGLVDAFGGVWVAGWKQKEHPVLYNALHIGDQLISVAGVAISCAADAHKTIRAAPGLFVELIIRRIPFGRVYAIRRELDGQCLGLIRDGNTATIVDVVPNSLAARHGLPPKGKSCDGLSLTFWVLTEINGRPLNLFFKEHEIRDRLNAVGRDISILVQPADLITKLKKQLKSLRGHKDFIVQ